MFKRFLFYSFLLFIISIGVYRVYDIYTPNVAIIVKQNPISYNFTNKYDFNQFENYIVSTEEAVNVIFYQEDDINSQYFFNTVIQNIFSNKSIERLDNVIYVEASALPSDSVTTKAKYGISEYPTMVNMTYAEGTITVNNSLCISKNNFDEDTIYSWFTKYNLVNIPTKSN